MLKTFKIGGLHLNDNKLSKDIPVEIFPIPETVYIPLIQHLGAPAHPKVKINDRVKTGQLIAHANGIISSNIHSSVTGTVIDINTVTEPNGFKRQTIIIKTEPDEWDDTIDTSNKLETNIVFSPSDIIKRIADAGIVGLGGATFPSHFKLSIPHGKAIETLIINGVECEPYVTSDYRLMLERAEEIIVGIKIVLKALNISKAYIGIENNKPLAIKHFQNLLKDNVDIRIIALKTKYPQGSEKHLIKAITMKEVPSGKLPIDVGVVVHNIATIYSIYEAVQKRKPLIERIVTVTGKSLSKPANYKVRIGTPVSKLIDVADDLPTETSQIIIGGPMMGKAVQSIDSPVIKSTNCVLVLSKKEIKKEASYNCIRCANCIKVCPIGLSPYIISSHTVNNNYKSAEKESIMDCIECGSCAYICPSNIPLLDNIKEGKIKISRKS